MDVGGNRSRRSLVILDGMPVGRILIVDDDANARTLVGAVLRSRGIGEFDIARDGREALHRLGTIDYALIILDVIMPVVTGIDVLESLHALGEGLTGKRRLSPDVIVMTSYTESDLPTEDILRHGRGRVRAVLRKPVSVAQLSSLLESHVVRPAT